MKRTQILATLAFAFMLGASVPFIELISSNNVSAAEQTEDGQATISTEASSTETQADTSTSAKSVTVDNITDFANSINDPEITEIILGSHLTDVDVDIDRAVSSPLTIDLAGYTISSGNGMRVLISQGDIRFTGAGTITATNKNALSLRGSASNTGAKHTIVTVDAGVTLSSNSLYGVAIVPYDTTTQQLGSYGVVLNMNGNVTGAFGMHINGSINDTANQPEVTIGSTANIAPSTAAASTPIYAAGTGVWTINGATMSGKAGIGIRSGEFTFTDAHVDITGPMKDNPTAGSNGMDVTGVVFQIEHHPAYADQIVLNVNGGDYKSTNGDVFYEYGEITNPQARAIGQTQAADINITGGTFTAGEGREIFGGPLGNADDANIEISGGTFDGTDATPEGFASFLADGFEINEDGTVVSTEPENPDTPTTPTTPSRPSGSTGSTEAPEGPSNVEKPSDTAPEQKPTTGGNIAPDTGLNQGRGVLTAKSTILSLICGAIGVVIMVCVQKIFSRRKAMNAADVEMEIDQQLAEIMDEPEEPVVERFVAEAIESEKPKVTPVDTFILQK